MSNVFIIVSVNGTEEKINLVENPSARKTEGKRFVLADYAGKNVKTFLNGKYFYINLPENKTKEKKQTSRKTETKKTETKEVSDTAVTNEMIKSKLFDDYISGKITAKDLKEISKQI